MFSLKKIRIIGNDKYDTIIKLKECVGISKITLTYGWSDPKSNPDVEKLMMTGNTKKN